MDNDLGINEFVLMNSLNEARTFLLELASDENDKEMATLALKTLLSLALARASVDDILHVVNLIHDRGDQEMDLIDEIIAIRNHCMFPT